MRRFSGVSYRLSNWYWGSGTAQTVYGSGMSVAAGIAELSGQTDRALSWFCDAARRVREPRSKARRLSQLAKFVSREFSKFPPVTLDQNNFVASFLSSARATQLQATLKAQSAADRARLSGNLIILKPPCQNERGVLLVQYTGFFEQFLVNFDLRAIGERYSIVLEPSWGSYPEPFWLYFSSIKTPVFCQLISDDVVQAVRELRLPMIPLAIGAQDWVDPDVFRPIPGVEKEFDVVMIASFARFKRHWVLFKAMQEMRPRRIKVAIIGRTWERTRAEFDQEIRSYGVQDDVRVFQGLSAAQVSDVVNRSKINLLLSKAEGGNRGIMEGWATNVPAVVYKRIIGPRHSDINSMTGMMAEDHELASVLSHAIDNYERFQPRKWFLENTGYINTTAKLNAFIKLEMQRRGEPWTTDIVLKANRHESQYVNEEDRQKMMPAWKELETLLRPL